jgi:pseudaminic acid biosynthesis-associated methylase
MDDRPESQRLEALWAGDFGDEYVDRNAAAYRGRDDFWGDLLTRHPCSRVLEIGCNIGGNLRSVAQHVQAGEVYGVDINRKALRELRRTSPEVNAVWSPARHLPYRDRWFDLVFTMGVLIHQPESTLPLVMSEMVRCSQKWILCGEYHAESTTDVPYRGHDGALFKRDYGRIFLDLFPELRLVERGFLGRDEGWDDVTWWLFDHASG